MQIDNLELLYEFIDAERQHFKSCGLSDNPTKYLKRIEQDIERFRMYRVPLEHFKLPMSPSHQKYVLRCGLEELGLSTPEIIEALGMFFHEEFKKLPTLKDTKIVNKEYIQNHLKIQMEIKAKQREEEETRTKKEFEMQQQIEYLKERNSILEKKLQIYKEN